MNIHIKNSHVQFTILMHSITELEIEILFLWESSLLFESVFDPWFGKLHKQNGGEIMPYICRKK